MQSVGIDTGGTFTDTVLADGERIYTVKTLTSDDLISGIMEGIERVCDRAEIDSSDVDVFSHGSTVAVNALIEETGAKTALIATKGFADILEIGKGYRDETLLYRPCGPVRAPLIPRRHRYGVPERIDAAGEVIKPLDLDAVDDLIDELHNEGYHSVGICLLHAYRNSVHERQIEERFAERTPHIDVSISSDVSPEIREYSRTATTAVDAYIKPEVSSYLSRLNERLHELGLDVSINVMNSDGGMAHPNIVGRRPVTQIISGPVAGVKAAQFIGHEIGQEDLITLDMGGTSCDTALVDSGAAVESAQREVRGMTINGPFVNVNTVGAGGGSIARLDDVNALRVGPQSAGADPGPVCYGFGGERPTVTDADLVLGLLNPENFAGGELSLDVEAAHSALAEQIADPLEINVPAAAVAIRDVIDSEMASAIRVVSVKEGYDPREFALMGFGGAGPMHACNIAAELSIDRVIFPNNPGLLSAFGLLVSDIKHEYIRSLVATVGEVDRADINQIIDDLVEQGTEELESEGIDPSDRAFSVSFDAMYTSQAHYLNIPLSATELTEETFERLIESFEQRHDAQYNFTDEREAIELVNVRVTAEGRTESPGLGNAVTAPDTTVEDAQAGTRQVVIDTETTVEAPYFDWSHLAPGHDITGPSIIELENSTIWIPLAFDAGIDRYGNVIVERGGG